MSLATSVLKCLSNLNLLLLQNFAFSKKYKSRGSAPSNDIFSNKAVAVTAFPVDPTFSCFMQLRHAEGQALDSLVMLRPLQGSRVVMLLCKA